MKSIYLLAFLLSTSVFASEGINDDNIAGILAHAKNKSVSAYLKLVKIDELSLSETAENNAYCELENKKKSLVSCIVTNVDEDVGWTDGIKIIWRVTQINGNNHQLQFDTIGLVEH